MIKEEYYNLTFENGMEVYLATGNYCFGIYVRSEIYYCNDKTNTVTTFNKKNEYENMKDFYIKMFDKELYGRDTNE